MEPGLKKLAYLYILFAAPLLTAQYAVAATVYKCKDHEGNITFSNVSCPEDTKTSEETYVETTTPSSSYSRSTPDTDRTSKNGSQVHDPNSIQNQLRRLEDRRDRERNQRRLDAQEDRLRELDRLQADANRKSAERQKAIDKANCQKYTARVKEQEYKLRKGYQTREQKLSDESYLGTLKSLKARYCY